MHSCVIHLKSAHVCTDTTTGFCIESGVNADLMHIIYIRKKKKTSENGQVITIIVTLAALIKHLYICYLIGRIDIGVRQPKLMCRK